MAVRAMTDLTVPADDLPGAAVPQNDLPDDTDRNVAAQMNIRAALATTPEKATQAAQLSAATGTPEQIVQRDPGPAQRQAALNTANAALAASPVLHDHVAADPNFTAKASDEFGLMAQLGNSISRGWRSLKEIIPASLVANRASALEQFDAIDRGEDVPLGAIGESYKEATPEERAQFRQQFVSGLPQQIQQGATRVANLEQQKRAFPLPGTVQAALSAPTWGETLKRIARHPLDFVASEGPESVIGAVPALAASIPAAAGGPGTVANTMGMVSFVQTLGPSMVNEFARRGVDVSNPAALAAALRDPQMLVPAIDAASKRAGIAGAFGLLTAGLASRFPSLKFQLPANAVAGAAQPVVEGAVTGEPATPGEVIAGSLTGAITAPVLSMIGHAASRVGERNQAAQQAVNDAENLQTISQQAAASKLRTRDPNAFQQFTERAVAESGGTAPEHVYVSAADLDNAIEQAKITPEQIERLAPTVGKQITIAQLAGADLQIPFSDFATHLAGTSLGDALIPHLRTSPEALTAAEATARDPA